jgi:hypothetical protein
MAGSEPDVGEEAEAAEACDRGAGEGAEAEWAGGSPID